MSADRRPAIPNLKQEYLFESAIEELSRWNPSPVDIENSLYYLSTIRDLRPNQAVSVLDLARENIEPWTESGVDPKQIVDALVPSFLAYRRHVSQQNNPDLDKDYSETVCAILSGVIENKPENYRKAVDRPLKEGVFGQPSVVLANLLKKPFEIINDGGDVWDDKLEDGYDILGTMLDDLIEMGDQDAIKPLKPRLPVAFMRYHIAHYCFPREPRVRELLESTAKDYPPNIVKLAQNYLTLEEGKKEELRKMLLEGQFGFPTTAARMLISALLEKEEQAEPEEKEEIKETVKDLWVDLLDKDRTDIGLNPIREMIIARPWGWEGKDVAYTAVDSLEALGLGEEEFVEKYGDLMLDTLEDHLFRKEKQDLKIPERQSREATKQGLIKILKDLGQGDTSSKAALFRNFPDRSLAESLYPHKRSPRTTRNLRTKS